MGKGGECKSGTLKGKGEKEETEKGEKGKGKGESKTSSVIQITFWKKEINNSLLKLEPERGLELFF